MAIEEADLILFVMDGLAGVTPLDEQVADLLRRTDKEILYVVNKIDNERREELVGEFYRLGISEPITISALHHRGTSDLLDRIEAVLALAERAADEAEGEAPHETRVAFVGCPNVGKSSLINAILGDPRMIVDDRPGTTRDAIHTPFTYDEKPFLLVDTAGIRRKSRVTDRVEKFSALKSLRSIAQCHIACLVLDATRPITDQDKRIAAQIEEAGRGVVLIANKWDLVTGAQARERYREMARYELRHLPEPPILFTSATTGKGVRRILPAVVRVAQSHAIEIATPELNRLLQQFVAHAPPPLHRNRPVKFYYATQTKRRPPTFTIFTNHPDGVRAPYVRYLKNRFREHLALEGTDLRLFFKARKRRG